MVVHCQGLRGLPVSRILSRRLPALDETAGLEARLAAPLERALSDAKLTPDQIDRVLLVGGATRMPAILGFAARKLRQSPTMGIDPDLAVALGAAVRAVLIADDSALDDVVMTDVSAFTLGVDMAERIGGSLRHGYFAPIIERNPVIPLSREMAFSTVELGQKIIRLGIYQGQSPLIANNLALGKIKIDVPANRTAHETVVVRFTYDLFGLLKVEATVLSTRCKANIVITRLAGEMSQDDIAAALRKMQGLKIHPRDQAETAHLRSRIYAAYVQTRGDQCDAILRMLVAQDGAIDAQHKAALAQMRREMHKALDDLEAGHVR